MSILVTGFSNFRNVKHNPSEELVNKLAAYYNGAIQTYVFKSSYAAIDKQLPLLLKKYRPQTILMFGLANRSDHVRLEKYAKLPRRLKATPAEESYASTLPLEKIKHTLNKTGIGASYSLSAGDYYCNYLFYKVCRATKGQPDNQHGFIHIPNNSLYAKNWGEQLDLVNLGKTIIDLLL